MAGSQWAVRRRRQAHNAELSEPRDSSCAAQTRPDCSPDPPVFYCQVQVLELPSKTSVSCLKPEAGARLGMPMCLQLWQVRPRTRPRPGHAPGRESCLLGMGLLVPLFYGLAIPSPPHSCCKGACSPNRTRLVLAPVGGGGQRPPPWGATCRPLGGGQCWPTVRASWPLHAGRAA